LVPAEGLSTEFRLLLGELRGRIRDTADNVTHERLCVAKTQSAGRIGNGVNKGAHALDTTQSSRVCAGYDRPLLQLRSAEEHNLVGNHGRVCPVAAQVSKKLDPARWLSGLRQRANERVGIHVVVHLMPISPVIRLLNGRAEDRRNPVQSRVRGLSVLE